MSTSHQDRPTCAVSRKAAINTDVLIRSATQGDGEALARIYNPYILETVITFEEQAVSAAEMASRVAQVQCLALPWLVAERGSHLIGYAYASRWKQRAAYRHSVETTVYLEPQECGQGLGSRLYEALLSALRAAHIHTAVGGIALPNPASLALHRRLGFRKVAQLREIGFKLGRWVDVGYWQKIL